VNGRETKPRITDLFIEARSGASVPFVIGFLNIWPLSCDGRRQMGGRAYFDARHNFLLVERLPELDGPYAVFFTMERSKHPTVDVAMFVISAYEKIGLPRNIPKITFATLVAKHARGESIRRPPHQ
jgi:hypothetical protein